MARVGKRASRKGSIHRTLTLKLDERAIDIPRRLVFAPLLLHIEREPHVYVVTHRTRNERAQCEILLNQTLKKGFNALYLYLYDFTPYLHRFRLLVIA